MKVLAPLFAFFALASAQGLTIGTPKKGQRIPMERPFTVQVIKNPHIISSIEVALTIGIVSCPQSSGCPDPSNVGEVLYQGPYRPRPHRAGGNYQNFTVTIPFDEDLIGRSQLTVNRFFLIGAQNGATLQSYGVEIDTFPL
ncbi:hypothetical protein M413DRAFT_449597 [Hebeloma cylindrosporum]|uniref:Phosphatidylglycerol/phosphatidylinositol transfer protein n=1 Tax=Hebeloma cylindrosporum TaxID=76867 RepID=A0A0C3BGA7_HEBCY|nr:hypothetical protein M413DRAFT_449597 [Hebeloma cylindrosporum h7]